MRDINDVFDEDAEVTEVELDEVSSETELDGDTKADINGDYNFVREQLIKSIIRGSELIDEGVKAAKIDASPRAVEAAAGAVKTLTDASKGLLDLHEKIRAIENEKPASTDEEDASLEGRTVVLKTTLSNLIRQIDEEDKAAEG
jgi:hypothetical protein